VRARVSQPERRIEAGRLAPLQTTNAKTDHHRPDGVRVYVYFRKVELAKARQVVSLRLNSRRSLLPALRNLPLS